MPRRRLIVSGAALGAAVATRRFSVASADEATHRPYRLDDGYATGDGIRLYFVRAGRGPLMLFLHGAPDSWALYAAQLAEFSRDHLVVAPNLRGYTPSETPTAVEDYAMPRLLGDVHGLIDHFDQERCILVGNDWGGYVAWVFASAYPTRVSQLIVINAPHPAIHLREVRENPTQNRASQYERDLHTSPAPYPHWHNYVRADPIKVPTSTADSARLRMPDLAGSFFNGTRIRPATTSLHVGVPVLVIWGMLDPFLLPGQLAGLSSYASNLTVVRIAAAGHYPMRSHSALVNRAMRDFVRRAPD